MDQMFNAYMRRVIAELLNAMTQEELIAQCHIHKQFLLSSYYELRDEQEVAFEIIAAAKSVDKKMVSAILG